MGKELMTPGCDNQLSMEQMRAWLILEGWVPYQKPNRMSTFTFSKDGRYGFFRHRSRRTMIGFDVLASEAPRAMEDVPEDEILSMYAMAAEGAPYEP